MVQGDWLWRHTAARSCGGGTEDAHCGFGSGVMTGCVEDIGVATGSEARARGRQRRCNVWFALGLELDGVGGARAVECGWKPSRSRQLPLHSPPPPLPHARFLPAAQSCGAKESADGVIA
jgi:hypothetical protein